MSLVDPQDFARRVRQCPYGPVEASAGSVSAWLHGPFCVLTMALRPDESVSVSLSANHDGLGDDVADFFHAAAEGADADLVGADRVVVEQRADAEPSRVTAVLFEADSGRLVLSTQDGRWQIMLRRADAATLTEALRQWATAVEDTGAPVTGGGRAG